MEPRPKILILGAGCTGLGAAYRLQELGHTDFLILEREGHAGGLAASFLDSKGFTWDVGGHVQFSHYDYFDRLMATALGDGWLTHLRQSYIWMYDSFIPYPFQNNLSCLPREKQLDCILGLLRARSNGHGPPANFRQWITSSFGEGIAEQFLLPYNLKVWAHPLERMGFHWIGERVAEVDLEQVLTSVLVGKEEAGWGPNRTFRFPASGGTGSIWKAVARLIPRERIRLRCRVRAVDLDRRIVRTEGGERFPYDLLISTLPLDVFSRMCHRPELERNAGMLRFSTTHIFGIGLRGAAPAHLRAKNWMYFPEGNCPFYRVTVFSNYSPRNVPDAARQWSLMAEVSESPSKPVDRRRLLGEVVAGMVNTRLISGADDIESTWSFTAGHGYPVPTVDRDEHLGILQDKLESMGVYSRGRFGAWKYEVANQDHSCMQGVELADRIVRGIPETTVCNPALANASRRRTA